MFSEVNSSGTEKFHFFEMYLVILLLTSLNLQIQSLDVALLEIRKMCCQISDTGLFHMEKKHSYSLHSFHDFQLKQLQEVRIYIYNENNNNSEYLCFHCVFCFCCQFLSDLQKFQVLVKEVVLLAFENFRSYYEPKSDNSCALRLYNIKPIHWIS